MDIVEKLITTLEGAFGKKIGNKPNHKIETVRQNSPPDEQDVDAIEDAADRQASSFRKEKRNSENPEIAFEESRRQQLADSDVTADISLHALLGQSASPSDRSQTVSIVVVFLVNHRSGGRSRQRSSQYGTSMLSKPSNVLWGDF